MKIVIINESIVILEALSSSSQAELMKYVFAIEAAPSIEALKSILPDDVISDGEGEDYNIFVKDNYQHVTACINIIVNNENEAILTFKAYD